MSLSRPTALLLVLMSGCRAQDQWTVYAATDAPVPQLGDRLLVELLGDGDVVCADCRRELAADSPGDWPLSFGVVPRAGAPPRVRARLFRSLETGADGLPSGSALIDALGQLPASPHGDLAVAITLRMSCFGVPADPAAGATCNSDLGAIAPLPELPALADPQALPRPGSWPPAQPVDCPKAPPPGAVCIPGGAFLLGGVHAYPSNDFLRPLPERLVQLGPFALDTDEFTVGRYRTLLNANQVTALPDPQNPDPQNPGHACTWLGPDVDTNDAQPLNCIRFDDAATACRAVDGGRLPTEAEWEYAAGNLAAETIFPWGSDPDECAHAVVGVGRDSLELPNTTELTDCRLTDAGARPWGPLAGGNPLDTTLLQVHNLGGNLSEWIPDKVAAYSDPCWSSPALLVDPECAVAAGTGTGLAMIRGASWTSLPILAVSETRNVALPNKTDVSIGFRCAHSL